MFTISLGMEYEMGMYCCCGVKISGKDYEGKPQCTCDWDGWISTCDWPPERKNKENPIQKTPPKSGKYLVRYSDNGGDLYEKEANYSETPLRYETTWGGGKYVVHWDCESWEEGHPYAWKETGVEMDIDYSKWSPSPVRFNPFDKDAINIANGGVEPPDHPPKIEYIDISPEVYEMIQKMFEVKP